MTGNGKTGTDGDFFVTVDPRNWKRLKEEEEEEVYFKYRHVLTLSTFKHNNISVTFPCNRSIMDR
jgi:hypothetical protein